MIEHVLYHMRYILMTSTNDTLLMHDTLMPKRSATCSVPWKCHWRYGSTNVRLTFQSEFATPSHEFMAIFSGFIRERNRLYEYQNFFWFTQYDLFHRMSMSMSVWITGGGCLRFCSAILILPEPLKVPHGHHVLHRGPLSNIASFSYDP